MSPSTEGRTRSLLDLVRAADRDRYLAALYAPEDKRADLLALYAFNAEIAGVRDRVRQALPGDNGNKIGLPFPGLIKKRPVNRQGKLGHRRTVWRVVDLEN